MSRRSARAVERLEPAMRSAVAESVGERSAHDAVEDRAAELGVVVQGGGLLVEQFEPGTCYWVSTTTYVYVGRCLARGVDFVVFGEASIVILDGNGTPAGRHSVMQRTGTAEGAAVEPTGGPARIVRIPIDVIGPSWEWPFEPFGEVP